MLAKDTTTPDLNYRNLDPPDVLVVNDDDEIPGLKVSAASGATTETKGTAFFTVKLLSKPSSTVRLNLSSSGTSEGRVTAISGSSVNIASTGTSYLEFSTTDWNSERSVTVTGQDDNVTDGNQAYAVTVWVDQANTADSGYDPLDNVTVLLSNVDDETSGFLVSGISGTVSEKQTSANFSVRLTSQPNGSVIFKAASDNTSEGSVSPSTHTFSSSNWSGEQAFTVTGVDDSVNDGDQAFRIVLTVDNNSSNTTDTSGYRLLNPPDVWVTNVDDETPGFYHTLPSGPTSEDNGTAVFTVGLQTQPTGNVVLDLGISDKTEGTFTSGSTDNDTQLSFTTANWNAPQTVTVWGLDDNDTDGTQGYTVTLAVNTASTLDADYDKLSSRMLSLSNTDDETAGFLVSVPSGSTSESGDNATFTVRLSSAPITGLQVMLDLSSSDTNEGRITAASGGSPSINSTGTSTLTFTSSTWNTPVTVTVTGQNDSSATRDGDQRYRINLSVNSASTTASEYRLLDPADVALVNTDDDQAGLRVSAPSTAELSESGDNATFTVTLNTAPTQTVTVPIYSSDPTEAKLIVNGGSAVDSDNLSFASGTTGPKTITVIAQNDSASDGDQPVRVILAETSSSDANYHGPNPQDVALTVTSSSTQMGGAIQGSALSLSTAVTTFAGTAGTSGTTDAAGTNARLNRPIRITTDGTNLYVAEYGNHTIRKIVISSGVVTTLAGSGSCGTSDGTGTSAEFCRPEKLTTDGTNIYVSDTGRQRIRKIVISSGVVTTLAGDGTARHRDGTGTNAQFDSPRGITTDGTNLYISDTSSHAIRKME